MPDPRGDETAYFNARDGHRIVGVWQDGRVVALGRYTASVGSGTQPFVVRVPDLKYIETILNVQFETSDPDTCVYEAVDKKVFGNLVGMTICGIQVGTTLTVEVVAVG